MRWVIAVISFAGWFGCYSPDPPSGSPCGHGACPYGLVCSPASQTCERAAVDAAVAPDSPADAALPDAPLPDAPPSGPVLVQQLTSFMAAPAQALSVVLASPPTSGHVLVMIGADPQASLASVTGGGATWTRATASTTNANIEVWVGVTDGSSSTVSISLPGSIGTMSMAVSEWAGLDTQNTLDVATATAGTTSPASAGTIVTANARDLLLFAVGDGGSNTFGVPTPGAWTPMMGIAGGGNTQAEWYRVVSATGSFAPTVTETSGLWDAALVALRIAP